MATDLERALARIAELETALQALHGFTPDDNEWMRRTDEAERFVEEMRITVEHAQQAEYRMAQRMEAAERSRDNALKDLAAERMLRREGDIKGVASCPPPDPIHGRSDAADALRYMMESRYIAPNPDLIKTVRGVGLADLSRILAKNVRP